MVTKEAIIDTLNNLNKQKQRKEEDKVLISKLEPLHQGQMIIYSKIELRLDRLTSEEKDKYVKHIENYVKELNDIIREDNKFKDQEVIDKLEKQLKELL